jgi:hypothetical protein
MSNSRKNDDIDQWEWEKNDRDFYHKFLKLPESRDRNYYKAMKEHRYRYGSTKHKIDLRPRVFFSVMKVEIILLIFGIGFAISNRNIKYA